MGTKGEKEKEKNQGETQYIGAKKKRKKEKRTLRLGSQNVGFETFGLQDCNLKAGVSISDCAAWAAEVVLKMASVVSRIDFTTAPRRSSSCKVKVKKGWILLR